MAAFIKSWKTLPLLLFLFSAIPLAIIFSVERSTVSSPRNLRYHSQGWLRECCKWDPQGRRFLVSFFDGGIGQIRVPEGDVPALLREETVVAAPPELAGRSFLGLTIDRRRNRVLVAVADLLGGRFGGLAAYDINTWQLIFLTQLSGPADGKTLADDVAVDDDGNAYVTDAKGNKIWKVGVNGELLSTIENDAFSQRKWYLNLVGLNGIVYHPDRFLLVVHTFSGTLLRVDVDDESVHQVDVQGSLKMADGMALLLPTQLVIAGSVTSGLLVESMDGWKTARVIGQYFGPLHRVATSVILKDDKAYLHYLVGLGFGRREHVMTEAVFAPVNSTSGGF